MANPCDNTFYGIGTKENIYHVEEYLKERFDADTDVWESNNDEYVINAWFESKWTFPEEAMDDMLQTMPDKLDIYMRCLSVEYGCLYHAMWVYNGGDFTEDCDNFYWTEV